MGHFSSYCQKINACGNDGESETTRKATESWKDAERSHAEGSPRDRTCSLNNGEPEEMGAFSLRKFCNGWLVRGTTSFCKVNCNFCLLERVKKWNVPMQFDE